MLHDFVTIYRDAIILGARAKMVIRHAPLAPAVGAGGGMPLMLTRLSQSLQLETTTARVSTNRIRTPSIHVRHLWALGFSALQVVHGYEDICQAITELAFELDTPIALEDFQTLDYCLDSAIAEALTEHALYDHVN
jgi:hypothetical protein